MRAFQFRLSQLHRLRQAEEEMLKRLLQESLAALEQAEQALHQANRLVASWSESMQQAERDGMTAAALQANRRWLPQLRRTVDSCQERWQQAEQSADRQRQSFGQARQRCKVLANLKDRQAELHRQEEQLLLQQEQDELAVMAWPRGEIT